MAPRLSTRPKKALGSIEPGTWGGSQGGWYEVLIFSQWLTWLNFWGLLSPKINECSLKRDHFKRKCFFCNHWLSGDMLVSRWLGVYILGENTVFFISWSFWLSKGDRTFQSLWLLVGLPVVSTCVDLLSWNFPDRSFAIHEPIPNHGKDGIFTYMDSCWFLLGKLVGKYTVRPMDAMGYKVAGTEFQVVVGLFKTMAPCIQNT